VRYDAILFDFDGVLVDSEPVHFECWLEILESFGMRMDWETYRIHGIGVSDRALMTMLCEQAGRPHEVDRLLAEYPRKKEMFRSRMLERQLIPAQVLNLLPELRAYQLAVVTSSGQSEVEPLLRDAGIHGLFNTVVYGGDVKQLKPAPDPYLLAMKRLEARTGLVLEDSDAGEASARAAGLDVLRVKSPLDLPELLRDQVR